MSGSLPAAPPDWWQKAVQEAPRIAADVAAVKKAGAPAPNQDVYVRNMAYADPKWTEQITKLPPDQEKSFQEWVQANKVPFDPSETADYDMRGFYKALMGKDPRAVSAVNPNDKQIHYPDVWKTPYHQTFSAESQWAKEGAPVWRGNKLVTPTGAVIYDEEASNVR